MRSRVLQGSALYRFQIIGEAISRLPADLKGRYPQVAWRQIRAFRNIAVHEYGNVDLEIVWSIIVKDLDSLRRGITAIRRNHTEES